MIVMAHYKLERSRLFTGTEREESDSTYTPLQAYEYK